MKIPVTCSDATPPLPVYSHATISKGMVYVSGSIGCDNEFKLVGGLKEQTRAGIENMAKILKSAGSDLSHCVKVNVYLTNIQEDFKPMNEIYLEYFKENPPSRTCVGVAALPLGACFEIECTAELP